MKDKLTKVSKFLSFVLRHQPGTIGLKLDPQGWCDIDELIANANKSWLTRESLQLAVETNDKQRFAISTDGTKIRANQGHSIDVNLELIPLEPPEFLLHGTASRFMDSISKQGLIKGQRQHVHLTECKTVAQSVGSRYGTCVILRIKAKQMLQIGFIFYQSANQVWLTDHVPFKHIEIIDT